MHRKPIALIRETRQGVFVEKVMDAIAPHLSIRSHHHVAIKINLSGFKEIYANTHYETVESLIIYLQQKLGVQNISVIEGSDGAFFSGKTTWDIFYKFRYKEVEMKGARLVNLDELPHENVLQVETIGGMRPIHFARFDCDYMISVIPPKTHNILPVFLSIPNLIGFIRPDERVFIFGASTQEIRRINFFQHDAYFQLIRFTNINFVSLLRQIRPSMVFVDGLYGMEGRGPVKGSPVFHGFSISGEDPVMVDALSTYIMGFQTDDLAYLDLAARAGLGSKEWGTIIGTDPQLVKFPYRPHPLFQRHRRRFQSYDHGGGRGGEHRNQNGRN